MYYIVIQYNKTYHNMIYYNILYYAILYYTVRYYTILYYNDRCYICCTTRDAERHVMNCRNVVRNDTDAAWRWACHEWGICAQTVSTVIETTVLDMWLSCWWMMMHSLANSDYAHAHIACAVHCYSMQYTSNITPGVIALSWKRNGE